MSERQPCLRNNNGWLRLVLAFCVCFVSCQYFIALPEVVQLVGRASSSALDYDVPRVQLNTNTTRQDTNKAPKVEQVTALQVENVVVAAPDARNRTILYQPQAQGRLNFDWRHNPPLSRYAKLIQEHQSNCSLPVQTFHIDNSFGIGSHIALWSQGVCNAMQDDSRIRTYNPNWLWLDQTLCNTDLAKQSPWLCYFPESEFLCGHDEEPPPVNVSDPRDLKRHQCSLLKDRKDDALLHEFRAASTEFLFSRVSNLVIREAERQVGLLFGPDKKVPPDLITVHVRWGDKFWEMELASATEYISAVKELLKQDGKDATTANIFVATEDPKVVDEFSKQVPRGWKVYYDLTVKELSDFRPKRGNRASHMSKNSKGRAGLVGMGSLLLALEAKYFVLTTKSNWSRVIDQLRRNVIEPRCQNCTRMIDLRPGIW